MIFVPNSLREAGRHLRRTFSGKPQALPADELLCGWCSVPYLYPGLHPDEVDNAEGGWPKCLLPLAREVWRRFEKGELVDEELYCSDATWAGIYDRMFQHEELEIMRRNEIAASYGRPPAAWLSRGYTR